MIAAPPPALAAAPARITIPAGAQREVRVTNPTREPAVVDVAPAGFALDLRGRPRVVAAGRRWIAVDAPTLALAPRETAVVTVRAAAPAAARPGDHPALLLLARRPSRTGLAIRLRIGIVAIVRVPGREVREVVASRVRFAGGRLRVRLANRGNLAERVRIRVVAGRRVLVLSRELLPGGRALLAVPAPPRASRAVVELRYAGRVLRRTCRLRR